MAGIKDIAKRFSRDLAFSIGAILILNATIQFALYPILERRLGTADFGVALTLIAVIAIVVGSPAVGAGYSRLIGSEHQEDPRGDYNIFITIACVIGIVAAIIATACVGWTSPGQIVGFCLLMVLTCVRTYGDVDFRYHLDYKGYLIYYCLVSVGYVVGVLLWQVFPAWWFGLVAGETLGILHLLKRGFLFRRPLLARSERFGPNMRASAALAAAYLLSNVIANADRILLMVFATSTAVSIFYIAGLMGKMVAMFTSPLNGVVIGYLTRYAKTISRRDILLVGAALLAISIVAIAVTVGCARILIPVMYPDVFDLAKNLFLLASAGQVLYFVTESYLIFVLKVAGERWQLRLNLIYFGLFFAAAIPGVILAGTMGLAWAIVGANLVRFALIALVGCVKAAAVGGLHQDEEAEAEATQGQEAQRLVDIVSDASNEQASSRQDAADCGQAIPSDTEKGGLPSGAGDSQEAVSRRT